MHIIFEDNTFGFSYSCAVGAKRRASTRAHAGARRRASGIYRARACIFWSIPEYANEADGIANEPGKGRRGTKKRRRKTFSFKFLSLFFRLFDDDDVPCRLFPGFLPFGFFPFGFFPFGFFPFGFFPFGLFPSDFFPIGFFPFGFFPFSFFPFGFSL